MTNYNVIRHKPLAGNVKMLPPDIDPFGSVEDVASADGIPTAGWVSDVPDIIQQTSSPSMYLRLTGYAVRVAYRANAPKLISYGGVQATLVREDVREETLGHQDGTTYFRTTWVLDYLLPSAPASLPLPANPLIGTSGGE